MIVNLLDRLTNSSDEYRRLIKSSESKILISTNDTSGLNGSIVNDKEPASIDLTVGERWFNLNDYRWYKLNEKGVVLKANEAATFETKEEIYLPLNIFGTVTGRGKQIYEGGIVSPGKIDPGFQGKLRVGFYNSGKGKKVMKLGDPLCSCYFFLTEETSGDQSVKYAPEPEVKDYYRLTRQKIKTLLVKNWGKLLTIAIALASLIVSIIK